MNAWHRTKTWLLAHPDKRAAIVTPQGTYIVTLAVPPAPLPDHTPEIVYFDQADTLTHETWLALYDSVGARPTLDEAAAKGSAPGSAHGAGADGIVSK